MKTFIIFLIRTYQKTLSRDKGFLPKILSLKKNICVFYPTCSDYTIIAIKKYGVLTGILMSIKRISRCHPWQEPSVDNP